MRDRRFVAIHRRDLLDRPSYALLARWAADSVERVCDVASHRGSIASR